MVHTEDMDGCRVGQQQLLVFLPWFGVPLILATLRLLQIVDNSIFYFLGAAAAGARTAGSRRNRKRTISYPVQ